MTVSAEIRAVSIAPPLVNNSILTIGKLEDDLIALADGLQYS